jgi:deoxyribose-phosphate aldolase
MESALLHVDHTLLDPCSTWERIKKLCEEAIKYHTASVCVPPTFIKRIRETFQNQLRIATVVGFPLGYHVTEVKCKEAACAIQDGCDEIDMVINLTDVKEGNIDTVEREIVAVKEVCGEHILKVIIETCYLTESEKIQLCQAVTDAKADYIKTSTGFGPAGATKEDVELFQKHIGPLLKIKASGGIATLDDLYSYLEMGCDRIGTSKAVSLWEQYINQ